MNWMVLSVPAFAIRGVNHPPPSSEGPNSIGLAVVFANPHLVNIQGRDFLSIVCS